METFSLFWRQHDVIVGLMDCTPQVKKEKVVKPRGARGWGGAWRAYVREKTFGTRGRPSFKALSAKYDEEKKAGTLDSRRLRGLGSTATKAGKRHPPRAGRSAFGPQGRDLQRCRLADLRASFMALATAVEPSGAALALGKQIEQSDASFEKCLSLARAAMRTKSAQNRQEEKDREAALVAFSQGEGREIVERAVREHTWLTGVAATPLPTPIGTLLQCPGCDLQQVQDAIAFAHRSKASKLSSDLQASWAGMHKIVMESDCDDTTIPDPPPSACLAAGVCLCTGIGKDLKKLQTRFLAEMKKVFHAKSTERAFLADGSIVVRFEANGSHGDRTDLDSDEGTKKELFYHIGLMYWKPYRPTLMELSRATADAEHLEEVGRLWVKATPCIPCANEDGLPDAMLLCQTFGLPKISFLVSLRH